MKEEFFNVFSEVVYMLKSPKAFSSALAESGNFSFKDIRFLLPAAAFILSSMLRALFIYVGGEDLTAVYTGIPITIESPLYVILSAGIIGDIFTLFALSALLSFYLPFIGSGRLVIRLPVLIVLIPVIYSALFFIPMPDFCMVIISLLAFAAMFIPAVKNKHIFLPLLNSILMFYVPLFLLEIFTSIFVFTGLTKCYFILNLCFSILSIVYFTAFCSGIFRISAAKSFAALLAAGIFLMAYFELLAFFGIISPEISQIISLS